jgi:hypothetical protein
VPGPTTEVLSDDLEELKAELHADVRDIRVNLDSVKDSLKAEIHAVDVRLARLSAEFGLAKWLLGATLVATLSQIGAGIWWGATVTAEVRHLTQAIGQQKPAPPPAPTPKVATHELKGIAE